MSLSVDGRDNWAQSFSLFLFKAFTAVRLNPSDFALLQHLLLHSLLLHLFRLLVLHLFSSHIVLISELSAFSPFHYVAEQRF